MGGIGLFLEEHGFIFYKSKLAAVSFFLTGAAASPACPACTLDSHLPEDDGTDHHLVL